MSGKMFDPTRKTRPECPRCHQVLQPPENGIPHFCEVAKSALKRIGKIRALRQLRRNLKVPDGWDVREPCQGDDYWRIVESPGTPHATVVDGRLTRDLAITRCHEIIRNRDRANRRFFERR